jgi:hypothetical protein
MTFVLQSNSPRAEFGWPGGDRPGEVVFRSPVANEVRDAIVAVVADALPEFRDGATLMALTPPDGAIGRYRLATPKSACFVRVSARIGDAELEQAITGWLKANGLAVNHLEIAGLPLSYGGHELRIDVRELLDARHDNGSLDDLQQVAFAVSKCHQLMRTFPRIEDIKARASERFSKLSDVRDAMSQGLAEKSWSAFSSDETWAMRNSDWLRAMVDGYAPRFDQMDSAQGLHAQVHRANVLFRRVDARAVLLDFEESVQTFAPVAWDMAYFVQRFCLPDAPDEMGLRDRLRVVRDAYGSPVPCLAAMMRQTAWFSMAILFDYHQRGIISPISEYDKFVRLETQARELAEILGAHFDA